MLELHAGVETVEIGDVQVAPTISAVVGEPSGEPLKNCVVEEFDPGWTNVLRSTRTDSAGVFSFAPLNARKLYYIQVSYPGTNPLRFRLMIRKRAKQLRLQMELST
jgi:Carboxypeptidase regulatory-like domain